MRWQIVMVLVLGCAYDVGPRRCGVRVDVVNSTLHKGLEVLLRRAVINALTRRGISTADGPVATVTITSVKGRPVFEVARKLVTGEMTVTTIVTLQRQQKRFSVTKPFRESQTEQAEKDAVSELADRIADWLATNY
ncbi:MAG: hypothetical protein DRP82_01200 [Planctomycetota bacterium]|nr:MAG: hypothetical protein DRP82_01200 [Planctomycetota bacterium]